MTADVWSDFIYNGSAQKAWFIMMDTPVHNGNKVGQKMKSHYQQMNSGVEDSGGDMLASY